MIRTILLWFLVNSIGLSQDAVLNLNCTRIISNNSELERLNGNRELKNVFSPNIVGFAEANEDLGKRILDKREGKELILKLNSINTMADMGFIESKINERQSLVFANSAVNSDSIKFDEEISDIYFKLVESERVVSLKEYKGNGKYLLIDFWGTWCKPC